MADTAPALALARNMCVRIAGQSEVALAPLDAALLAWLALEGATPRARITALLWPDKDAEAARNSLRQRLFKLRKQLGVELVSGSTTLALADGVQHDLDDADSVLGDADVGIDGEFATWLEQQRGRRRTRMRQSLVELSDMAERAREWDDALVHAGELLELEPLSEDAHRRVMRLHYLAGDRAAALVAFDRCEGLLKDEVGAKPSPETLALLSTIESAAPTDAIRPAVVPVALLRPPRLVGRDAERALLARAFAQRKLLLLFGEAGMGKSRLLESLDERPDAATGDTLSVTARPGDASVPYAVAAKLMRVVLGRDGVDAGALRPDLALVLPEFGASPPGDREQGRARLVAAVDSLLATAVEHGLHAVVVDDLQFADEASIEMFQPLVGSRRCAWFIAMRPAELRAAARALVDAQSESPETSTIELRPLDVSAIGQLLDCLAVDSIAGQAQAEALHRRTGGNPLFLLETLKAGIESAGSALVPRSDANGSSVAWPTVDNVRRLIQQRLARLSPLANKVMRCAAVAGQDLSSPLVAQVLGLLTLDLADAWGELEAAQVLRGTGFAHDLIAEAALASVPGAIARPLHAEVAAYLDAAQGESLRVAEHWLAADQALKAAPHLSKAARRARAAWQDADAARLHEHAATILREAGDRRRAFDAYFLASEALADATSFAPVVKYRDVLEELADDDGQRAMVGLVSTALLIGQRRFDEAHRVASSALAQAQSAGLSDIEVELLWALTVVHWERRELADAAQCAEQAIDRLAAVDPATARLDLRGTRTSLISALGVMLKSTGRYTQGEARMEQAFRLAEADRRQDNMRLAASALASCALERGDLPRALEWNERLLQASMGAAGMHLRDALSLTGCSETLGISGDLGGALKCVELAAQLCAQGYVRQQVQIKLRLHRLQFELGRLDLAVKGLHELAACNDLQSYERAVLEAALLYVGERADGAAVLEQASNIDDFSLRARILCLAQPGCGPLQVLPLLSVSLANARDYCAHGLWLSLQTRRVAVLRVLGRQGEAERTALAVWQRLEQNVVGLDHFPSIAAELCTTLASANPDLVQVIALRASAWMQRAASTLPPEWRDNYLHRSPAVAILHALPAALQGAPSPRLPGRK